MTLPVSLDSLRTGLAQTHQRVKVSSGGSGDMYLKLPKTGIWCYGPDDVEVEENSLWAVNPGTFMVGYISWEPDKSKAAAKLGEMMVPATNPPIDPTTLPQVAGPWDEQMAMSMTCVYGEDQGTRLVYNTTSKGGLRAVNGVLGEIVARLNDPSSGNAIVPVIELLVDSYTHKRYGKVFVPEFRVHKWLDLSEASGGEAPQDDLDALPEPEVMDAIPPEEAPPEEAPKRRRRRRAA